MQDLGVLVSTQNTSDSTLRILNFKNVEKMKHPNTASCKQLKLLATRLTTENISAFAKNFRE